MTHHSHTNDSMRYRLYIRPICRRHPCSIHLTHINEPLKSALITSARGESCTELAGLMFVCRATEECPGIMVCDFEDGACGALSDSVCVERPELCEVGGVSSGRLQQPSRHASPRRTQVSRQLWSDLPLLCRRPNLSADVNQQPRVSQTPASSGR